MSTHEDALPRWRPTPVGIVASVLVIAGLLLSQVNWWFLIVAGIGAFGPGALREFGVLRDQDELQRASAHRAAFHAYLVTGFAAFVLLAVTDGSNKPIKGAESLSVFYLGVLWFTWMFSSLLRYWGARTTAFRTLIVFGCAWGVFNVLGNLHSFVGMAMQLLVTTAPFFALAFGSRRWPRVAGALLVLLAAGFAVVYFRGFPHLVLMVKLSVAVLFLVPLFSSGIALLARPEPEAA